MGIWLSSSSRRSKVWSGEQSHCRRHRNKGCRRGEAGRLAECGRSWGPEPKAPGPWSGWGPLSPGVSGEEPMSRYPGAPDRGCPRGGLRSCTSEEAVSQPQHSQPRITVAFPFHRSLSHRQNLTGRCVSSVSCRRCTTGWRLKQPKVIVSRFWRPEVWDEGNGRVGAAEAARENLLQEPPPAAGRGGVGCVLAILGGPWLQKHCLHLRLRFIMGISVYVSVFKCLFLYKDISPTG